VIVWKVIHSKDGIETVYLVNAESSREARAQVLDTLYERNHPVDPPYPQEMIDNDPFRLLAHTQRHGVDWTDAALCRMHGCSVGATQFAPDSPYRLYALNTKTGEMS
jgi:hypothetical protein